jgi:protein SCO1/2
MRRAVLPALVFAGLTLLSCNRPPTESALAPRTFTVQGVLRAIDFAGQSVTVEHEDIPDYMPAMTMPFDVKSMAEVEPLRAGDAIEFKMLVTDKAAWIEGVKKVDPREIHLPERKQEGAGAGEAARLKEGDPLPDFQLVDSKGRQITRQTFIGRPLLLTFIFTRCPIPTFCPLITNQFGEVRQALAGLAETKADVQLLSISFDSEFDKPEVLAQYAARHTADTDHWRFASGTSAETRKLTAAFSLSVTPESGTLSHGLATALIGAAMDGSPLKSWRRCARCQKCRSLDPHQGVPRLSLIHFH